MDISSAYKEYKEYFAPVGAEEVSAGIKARRHFEEEVERLLLENPIGWPYNTAAHAGPWAGFPRGYVPLGERKKSWERAVARFQEILTWVQEHPGSTLARGLKKTLSVRGWNSPRTAPGLLLLALKIGPEAADFALRKALRKAKRMVAPTGATIAWADLAWGFWSSPVSTGEGYFPPRARGWKKAAKAAALYAFERKREWMAQQVFH